jgi:hypothetical protein
MKKRAQPMWREMLTPSNGDSSSRAAHFGRPALRRNYCVSGVLKI